MQCDERVVGLVTDAVDVDGRQREMTALTPIAAQPCDADAAERAAQPLVLREQLRGDAVGHGLSLREDVRSSVSIAASASATMTDNLIASVSISARDGCELGECRVERFGLFHELELLILELSL